MHAAKTIISVVALAALFGCEHQDGKTNNAVSSATDKNLSSQSQTGDSPVTNPVDSKAVIPSSQSAVYVVTNQQSEEIWTSDGFGFEDISLTNVPVVEERGTAGTGRLYFARDTSH